jgi:predicted nucleotidyltransferase
MPKQTRLQKFMEILRQQRPMLAEQYNVATLEIFGSYVRHEQRKNSDLDILVTFSKPPSLFKFVRLENHLSDILVMKDSLKPAIGKNILREVVPV